MLSAVPFVLFLVYFTSQYQPPLLHWFVLEKTVISISAVVGGVLLWRGKKWGHQAGIIAWALVTFTSLWSVASLYLASGQPGITQPVITTWISKDVIYLLIAIPVLYVLICDLFQAKRTRT